MEKQIIEMYLSMPKTDSHQKRIDYITDKLKIKKFKVWTIMEKSDKRIPRPSINNHLGYWLVAADGTKKKITKEEDDLIQEQCRYPNRASLRNQKY